MRIPFWKMHGAGNDFLLIDDRAGTFPLSDKAWLARIAARRTGVGSDGIVLIQSDADADFRMRFVNPDGGEVDMCANGARCVARLAHELGVAPRHMAIRTGAGRLSAEVDGAQVRLTMTPPTGWRLDCRLDLDGTTVPYSFVNTGVPHVVIERDDLRDCPVVAMGRAVRRHADFAPAGTNVNFVRVTGPSALAIRTYERGVEDETLACGTGIVASALVTTRRGRVRPPVAVTAASGDVLTVAFTDEGGVARDVTLRGPAVHVFEGVLDYP